MILNVRYINIQEKLIRKEWGDDPSGHFFFNWYLDKIIADR